VKVLRKLIRLYSSMLAPSTLVARRGVFGFREPAYILCRTGDYDERVMNLARRRVGESAEEIN
jgi:hypothetical protein